MTGRGAPGTLVRIFDEGGNQIGYGYVGSDGIFQIGLNPRQNEGQSLSVTLTDNDTGKNSLPVEVFAPSIPAPEAPTGLEVAINGLTLTGLGVPGTVAHVYDEFGNELGRAIVGSDGRFLVTLNAPQTTGGLLIVQLEDVRTEKYSHSGDLYAPDLTKPDASTAVEIDITGTTVTGQGRPGTEVLVRNSDGDVIATGIVGPDGKFAVEIERPQTRGEHLEIVLVNPLTGAESEPTGMDAPDLRTPEAPTDLQIDDTGVIVSGKGVPGNTVKVYDASHNVIGEGQVGPDGTFRVVLDERQDHGEELSVTQTSRFEVESEPVQTLAPDLTEPAVPADIAIDNSGTHVTGTGTPGNTVKVYDDNGNVIGEATAGPDGKFDITISPAQTQGETVTVTQTSAYGVEGPSFAIEAPDLTEPQAPHDLTPPAEPTDVAVDNSGWFVTGKGEPGSKVTVYDANHNVIGEGEVGADGNFTINLEDRQDHGEHLTVTQTSRFEVESQPVDALAPDLTPPAAPGDIAINNSGTHVTGTGTPGNTVKVYDKNNNLIGTGTVDPNGAFIVVLEQPYFNHEKLVVKQVSSYDVEGNGGSIYAPGEPYDDLVSPAGQRAQYTATASLSDGGWVVTWSIVGGTLFQQRYNRNGEQVGHETQINSAASRAFEAPVIQELNDGGWVVAWYNFTAADGYHAYQIRYDKTGTAVTDILRVDSGNNDARGMSNPSMTSLADGGWVVTWERRDGTGSLTDKINVHQ